MFEDIKFDEKGLVPCVAQDVSTGEVLMLAYTNKEALELTIETGYATYFSRSRQEIWVKGKTSGNLQKIVSVKFDCDKDTILFLVEQAGPACHTGEKTCFFTEASGGNIKETRGKEYSPLSNALFREYRTITDRRDNPKENSYTNYLLDKGVEKICKKVGEEASEIIIAAMKNNKEELVYEISDFMYHVSVLMADQNITWQDIFSEIDRRRK